MHNQFNKRLLCTEVLFALLAVAAPPAGADLEGLQGVRIATDHELDGMRGGLTIGNLEFNIAIRRDVYIDGVLQASTPVLRLANIPDVSGIIADRKADHTLFSDGLNLNIHEQLQNSKNNAGTVQANIPDTKPNNPTNTVTPTLPDIKIPDIQLPIGSGAGIAQTSPPGLTQPTLPMGDGNLLPNTGSNPSADSTVIPTPAIIADAPLISAPAPIPIEVPGGTSLADATSLVQLGSGNQFIFDIPAALRPDLSVVIQNALDNTLIQNINRLDASVSSLQPYLDNNFILRVTQPLIDSVR